MALLVGTTLLTACAGGSEERQGVSVDDDATGVGFPGLVDESIMVGESSFLLVGLDEAGGAVAVHLAVEEGELQASVVHPLARGRFEENDLSALELADGSWVVTALGCETTDDCDDTQLYAFRVHPREGVQPLGAFTGLGLGSVRPLGETSPTRVLLAGGASAIEGGGHHRGDEVGIVDVGTYTGRYLELDLERRTVTDLGWAPPTLSYNPRITDAAQLNPIRADCLHDNTLLVLDSVPSDGRLQSSLTEVPLDRPAEASALPIDLPDGDVPAHLACDGPEPTIFGWSPSTQQATAYPLRADATVGEGLPATSGDAVLDISYGPRSALVRVGTPLTPEVVQEAIEHGATLEDGPPNTTTAMRAWVDSGWRDVPYAPPPAALVRVADDGRSLLVRLGDEYEGVQL